MALIAAIQMASGTQVPANLLEAERRLAEAAARGAELAVLPENFALMGDPRAPLEQCETPGEGPIQTFLRENARRLGMWIVAGTVPLREPGSHRVRAACLVFNAAGEQVVRYDKMHLFDVRLPNSEECYAESEVFEPGSTAVVVDTPVGRLGLVVCYDLRFPELFRGLLEAGAEGFVVPAAFTAPTGQAHWEALLRARAIENQAFVVAAAQGGFHVNGRETWGHSLYVDPWGRVLQTLARTPGVLVENVDLAQVRDLRQRFPAVGHRRFRCVLDASMTAAPPAPVPA